MKLNISHPSIHSFIIIPLTASVLSRYAKTGYWLGFEQVGKDWVWLDKLNTTISPWENFLQNDGTFVYSTKDSKWRRYVNHNDTCGEPVCVFRRSSLVTFLLLM